MSAENKYRFPLDIYNHYHYKDKHMVHCNQCGFDWEPRVANPRACTRCKRYDWADVKKGVRSEIQHSSHSQQSGDGILSGGGKRGGSGLVKNSRGAKAEILTTVLTGARNTKFGDVISDPSNSEKHLEYVVCKACEGKLREIKGKLACADLSCGLYGQEQR